MDTNIVFSPQPGPQTQFMACNADIVFFGGSAGGGKTAAATMEGARGAVQCEHFSGLILRRENSQIRMVGGLLDATKAFYSHHATLTQNPYEWRFGPNSKIQLRGMQYESDKENFQGAELDYICFEEVTQFTESQFWYLYSRARSKSGRTIPYIRATCNPEPGWVADLIGWWINEEGYAIEDRSGVIRWFVRPENDVLWFDDEEEANAYIREIGMAGKLSPTSFTFIRSKLDDNQILMQKDPKYIQRLHSLPVVERMRLLDGNWKIKEKGKIFNIEDFRYFSGLKPSGTEFVIITVDTAQEVKQHNDYTVMQVWCLAKGNIYLLAQARGKWKIGMQVTMLENLCLNYKPNRVHIENKANGKALAQTMRQNNVAVFPVRMIERMNDKFMRASITQPYHEAGHVFINPGSDYFKEFIAEVSGFAPENKDKIHDDQVDAFMDGIQGLLIDHRPPKNKAKDNNINNGILKGAANGKFTAFKGA